MAHRRVQHRQGARGAAMNPAPALFGDAMNKAPAARHEAAGNTRALAGRRVAALGACRGTYLVHWPLEFITLVQYQLSPALYDLAVLPRQYWCAARSKCPRGA
jgi:hypothetical protein